MRSLDDEPHRGPTGSQIPAQIDDEPRLMRGQRTTPNMRTANNARHANRSYTTCQYVQATLFVSSSPQQFVLNCTEIVCENGRREPWSRFRFGSRLDQRIKNPATCRLGRRSDPQPAVGLPPPARSAREMSLFVDFYPLSLAGRNSVSSEKCCNCKKSLS
jgi:hypothetical protein